MLVSYKHCASAYSYGQQHPNYKPFQFSQQTNNTHGYAFKMTRLNLFVHFITYCVAVALHEHKYVRLQNIMVRSSHDSPVELSIFFDKTGIFC